MYQQAALDLPPMPLNREDWDSPNVIEAVHEGMLKHHLRLLRDCTRNSAQWKEVVEWLDAPIVMDGTPLTFATCCRVMGIEDPEQMRDNIKKLLDLT